MDTCLWLLNVCLFCPILFYVSGTFKYYTKVFICVVYVTVGSFFVIVLSLWRPGDAENNRYSSIFCILFHRLLGITVAVTGQENVLDEPCVLVSNHQSALDIFEIVERLQIMDTCLWLLNVCLFCPILFYVSGTFKYYTKVFICVVYVTVGSFFVIVLSLWRPGDAENNRYSSIFCILFHRLLGITVAVTGQENVLDEPCVLVSNHQSALDIFEIVERLQIMDTCLWLLNVCLFCPILFYVSGTFKYYTKVFICVVYVTVGSFFVIVLSLWRPGDAENNRYSSIFCILFHRLLGITVAVTGQENVLDEPCVLVSNHQSALDIFEIVERLQIMDTCLWLLNVCLFCPILCYVSGTFKYYTKVFICVVWFTVGSFFVIVLSLWRPGDAENNRYSSICCILFHRLLGITVAVTGQENVLDEPCVLVSNHQSALDIFAVLAIRPPRCVFLSKKEVRFLFLFGVATMLTGHVFIDRGNSKKAIATLNKTAEDMLQKKLKLFVFPEGTRHSDGPMLPFKKGAFHLAIQAQVPVLPVVITGYDTFYSSKHKRFDTGTVTVHFLPKISTEGMSLSDVGPLAEQVRDIMVEKFARCQNSETSD